MNMSLFLASKSASRKMLLEQALIPFVVVEQNADEGQCDWTLPLVQAVQAIARYKMDGVILPVGKEDDRCLVLTADTLSCDATGTLSGKPVDRADAIEKIKASRGGVTTGTAFCLDRKKYSNGVWHIDQRIEKFVSAEYIFDVPDNCIEEYLEKSWALNTAGAVALEEYGAQFLKEVHGSYTTIIGLPMFELREALSALCKTS